MDRRRDDGIRVNIAEAGMQHDDKLRAYEDAYKGDESSDGETIPGETRLPGPLKVKIESESNFPLPALSYSVWRIADTRDPANMDTAASVADFARYSNSDIK